jgi:hypothetical protein
LFNKLRTFDFFYTLFYDLLGCLRGYAPEVFGIQLDGADAAAL